MSMRRAIKDFCIQCLFDKHEKGGKLEQVYHCTAPECPLYRVRLDRSTLLRKQAENGRQETV